MSVVLLVLAALCTLGVNGMGLRANAPLVIIAVVAIAGAVVLEVA